MGWPVLDGPRGMGLVGDASSYAIGSSRTKLNTTARMKPKHANKATNHLPRPRRGLDAVKGRLSWRLGEAARAFSRFGSHGSCVRGARRLVRTPERQGIRACCIPRQLDGWKSLSPYAMVAEHSGTLRRRLGGRSDYFQLTGPRLGTVRILISNTVLLTDITSVKIQTSVG